MSNETNRNDTTTDASAKTVTHECGARFDVFSITKGASASAQQRWTKLGSAFVNRDGSLNVYLEATPLDGKLHIRKPAIRGTDSTESGNN